MMRVWFFPPIFLALTACSTKTLEVKIPIPVPCITETIPEPTYPIVKEDAGIFERGKDLTIVFPGTPDQSSVSLNV